MQNQNEIYWNHNTAYHKWVLSQIKKEDKVLDVGCGDGLLVDRLSKVCTQVIGIDSHLPSIEAAKRRLSNSKNAEIVATSFEEYNVENNSFDVIIFVASIHHMDFEPCIKKAKQILKPKGKLLIVGLADPKSFSDYFIEVCRIIPAKIGDFFHNCKKDIGVPIKDSKESMNDIRRIINNHIPDASLKRVLYYRYLLKWIK